MKNNHVSIVPIPFPLPGLPFGELLEAVVETQKLPKVRQVIFNPPATIVRWSDGTKTVAHCNEQDTFSEEVGLAMACAKKLLHPYESFQECLDNAVRLTPNKMAKKPQKVEKSERAVTKRESGACPTSTNKVGLDELLRLFASGAPNGAIEATIVFG